MRAGGRLSFGKGDPAELPGKAFPGDGIADKICRTVRFRRESYQFTGNEKPADALAKAGCFINKESCPAAKRPTAHRPKIFPSKESGRAKR